MTVHHGTCTNPAVDHLTGYLGLLGGAPFFVPIPLFLLLFSYQESRALRCVAGMKDQTRIKEYRTMTLPGYVSLRQRSGKRE